MIVPAKVKKDIKLLNSNKKITLIRKKILLHIIFSRSVISLLILYKESIFSGNKTFKIVKFSKILNLKDAGYEYSNKWFSYYLLHINIKIIDIKSYHNNFLCDLYEYSYSLATYMNNEAYLVIYCFMELKAFRKNDRIIHPFYYFTIQKIY